MKKLLLTIPLLSMSFLAAVEDDVLRLMSEMQYNSNAPQRFRDEDKIPAIKVPTSEVAVERSYERTHMQEMQNNRKAQKYVDIINGRIDLSKNGSTSR